MVGEIRKSRIKYLTNNNRMWEISRVQFSSKLKWIVKILSQAIVQLSLWHAILHYFLNLVFIFSKSDLQTWFFFICNLATWKYLHFFQRAKAVAQTALESIPAQQRKWPTVYRKGGKCNHSGKKFGGFLKL
jgi:hypothetical protein